MGVYREKANSMDIELRKDQKVRIIIHTMVFSKQLRMCLTDLPNQTKWRLGSLRHCSLAISTRDFCKHLWAWLFSSGIQLFEKDFPLPVLKMGRDPCGKKCKSLLEAKTSPQLIRQQENEDFSPATTRNLYSADNLNEPWKQILFIAFRIDFSLWDSEYIATVWLYLWFIQLLGNKFWVF